MKQLMSMKENYEKKGFHLQRVYCRRRKDDEGQYQSTFGDIMKESTPWRKKMSQIFDN